MQVVPVRPELPSDQTQATPAGVHIAVAADSPRRAMRASSYRRDSVSKRWGGELVPLNTELSEELHSVLGHRPVLLCMEEGTEGSRFSVLM